MLVLWIFASLLAIGGGLHAYGSMLAFPKGSPARVWALGSAIVPILLAALAAQPVVLGDWGLRLAVSAGSLAWLVTVAGFGRTIRNILDPRVLYHLVVAAGLVLMLLVAP